MYRRLMNPLLSCFDSEWAHHMTVRVLHHMAKWSGTRCLLPLFSGRRIQDSRLSVDVMGMRFDNPLLVGGGWDKHGLAVRALFEMGFAGVEVGTVTEHPQAGNPKPRQFMINEDVALNRLGFPGPGVGVVASHLSDYQGMGIPLGISLGKNKTIADDDAPETHAVVCRRLYHFGDYFVINVSSPNTPGLRVLQSREPLEALIDAVQAAMLAEGGIKPLLVKISPDLSFDEIDDVIDVALDKSLAGVIACNTTNSAEVKAQFGARWANQAGGVSGAYPPYVDRVNAIIAHIARAAAGRLTIIGVGGVVDVASAVAKFAAGADLLQIVTGLRSHGPRVANQINRGLLRWMIEHQCDGIQSIRKYHD